MGKSHSDLYQGSEMYIKLIQSSEDTPLPELKGSISYQTMELKFQIKKMAIK
jgi:hypothetical protein